MSLTPKERRFVEAYNGNASEAAAIAGYARPATGHRILSRPDVADAIQNRERPLSERRIMDRTERQAWWTAMILDTTLAVKYRLKASELLAKSEADFIIRHELSGPNGNPIELQVESDESIRDRIAGIAARFRTGTDPQRDRN